MNLIILLINIYFLETENESNKIQIKNEKKSTNGSNHQQNGNSCKNNSLKIKNDVIAKFFYFIKKMR